METKTYFPAEIVGIKPGPPYEGKSYDQYVRVRLENGKRIWLYDPNFKVQKDMRGKTVGIAAGLISEMVNISEKNRYAIMQKIKPGIGLKGRIASLGRTEFMGTQAVQGVINCGAAAFTFRTRYGAHLRLGDFICLEEDGNRADINEVVSLPAGSQIHANMHLEAISESLAGWITPLFSLPQVHQEVKASEFAFEIEKVNEKNFLNVLLEEKRFLKFMAAVSGATWISKLKRSYSGKNAPISEVVQAARNTEKLEKNGKIVRLKPERLMKHGCRIRMGEWNVCRYENSDAIAISNELSQSEPYIESMHDLADGFTISHPHDDNYVDKNGRRKRQSVLVLAGRKHASFCFFQNKELRKAIVPLHYLKDGQQPRVLVVSHDYETDAGRGLIFAIMDERKIRKGALLSLVLIIPHQIAELGPELNSDQGIFKIGSKQ